MSRAVRTWLVYGTLLVLLLALGLSAWVYFASEAHLRSFPRAHTFSHLIPEDAASIARGDHLVRTRGCRGCHGDDLGGELMWGTSVAPNLTRYVHQHSPATFEAALRQGIGRDGRAMYSMPAYNFLHLSDEDVAAIYAYLRSLPLVPRELPATDMPWRVRLDLALGRDSAIPGFLDRVPPLRHDDDPATALARGEYLAMTTCNECHGFGLRADVPWEGETAPDLVIIRAYDEANFRRLMKDGTAIGERELDMMSGVARSRFAYFTDEELADLFLFLQDMAEKAGMPPSAKQDTEQQR